MLEFKEAFNIPVRHDIEILVDNARTHTAQVVNMYDFRLHPNGQCPGETLYYIDDGGVAKNIDCFDENGESKSLKQIAIELGYSLPEKIRIDEIRKILIENPAFSKVIFCPKYHCELNPTEGLWCNQKQYIRKRTDQTFVRLHLLLVDSRVLFLKRQLCQNYCVGFGIV